MLAVMRHVERVLHRPGDVVDESLGETLGVLAGRHGVAQDGELVAAEPGHQVAVADRGAQPLGGLDQHRVAGLVAAAVVDQLEVVEVAEQQRHRSFAGQRPAQGLAGRGQQGGAVRQPGELVVRRVVHERLGRVPLGGHVLDHRDEVRRSVGGVAGQRDRELSPDRRSRAGQVALDHPVGLRTAGQQHLDVRDVDGQVLGMRQGLEGEAGQLAAAVAEQPAERVVGLEQHAVQPDDRHPDGRVPGGQPEALLGGGQRGRRLVLGGDVGDCHQRRGRAADGGGVDTQPAPAARGVQADDDVAHRAVGEGECPRPAVGRERAALLVDQSGQPLGAADQVAEGVRRVEHLTGDVHGGQALVQGVHDMAQRQIRERAGSRSRQLGRVPREPHAVDAHDGGSDHEDPRLTRLTRT